jgi:hypothetical protein
VATPHGFVCFDDHGHRFVELERNPRGRVEVQQIRKGQLFALPHDRGTKRTIALAIPGARLMRVLAVAEIANLRERRRPTFGQQLPVEISAVKLALPIHAELQQRRRNRLVVGRRVRDGAPSQIETQNQIGPAGLRKCREHAIVVRGLDHDQDIAKILGGRAHHARSTDIDFLNQMIECDVALRGGRRKRIQIDDDQIDRRDALRRQRGEIIGTMADARGCRRESSGGAF